jgi:predicted nucleic acid-binding protein
LRFLLDTNALSEPQRPRPDEGYIDWLSAQDRGELAISSVTLGEVQRGARLMTAGARQSALQAWITRFVGDFGERILPLDVVVARAWADLSADLQRRGRTVGLLDELIAATALAHGLIIVTRNVRDFEPTGCGLLSPWSAPAT